MKATIHRPDGTRIEADGTAEEIAALAGLVSKVEHHWHFAPPCALPHYPTYPIGQPIAPFWWNPVGGLTFNNAAACAPNMGAVWIGELSA